MIMVESMLFPTSSKLQDFHLSTSQGSNINFTNSWVTRVSCSTESPSPVRTQWIHLSPILAHEMDVLCLEDLCKDSAPLEVEELLAPLEVEEVLAPLSVEEFEGVELVITVALSNVPTDGVGVETPKGVA